MAGSVLVVVLWLLGGLLAFLGALVAVFLLARRNGQAVKKMSWSIRHGYTAEFFSPKNSSERNIH
jgi:hypothetical protein